MATQGRVSIMFGWVKQHSMRVNKAIGNVANWSAVFGLLGGGALLTWAASSVAAIAQYGWGAVLFAGMGVTGLIVLVICAGLVSWRFFHPVPVYAQLPMPAPATEAPHARGYDREVRYDLSILLHFAVDQATGALLDNLAMTAPRHDGLTAETDPKIRRRRINEIEAFIRR